jgi:hypothetical protein
MNNFEKFILSITCKKLKIEIKFDLGTFYEVYDDFNNGITASYFGYDSLLEWINYSSPKKSSIVCYNLATRGYFSLLKKAVFNNYPLTFINLFINTFKNGQIDIIKWLVSVLDIKRDNLENLIYTNFINTENGKELFKYIINKTSIYSGEQKDIIFNLYKMGHFDLINWMKDKYNTGFDNIIYNDNNNYFIRREVYNCFKNGNLNFLKILLERYNVTLPEESIEVFISKNYINDNINSQRWDCISKEKYYDFLIFLKTDQRIRLTNVIELALNLCRSEVLIWALENVYNTDNNSNGDFNFTYKGENVKNVLQDIFDCAIHFLNLDQVKYFCEKGCKLNSEKILSEEIFKVSDYNVLEFLNNNGITDKNIININQQQPLINIFLEKSEIFLTYKVIDIWINGFGSIIDSNTLKSIIHKIYNTDDINENSGGDIKKILYDCIEKFNMPYDDDDDEIIKIAEDNELFFFIKYLIDKKEYRMKSIKLKDGIDLRDLKKFMNYIKYLLSKEIPWDNKNDKIYFWELNFFKKIDEYFISQNENSFQIMYVIEEIMEEYEMETFQKAIFLIENECPSPTNIKKNIYKMIKQISKKNLNCVIYNENFWNF